MNNKPVKIANPSGLTLAVLFSLFFSALAAQQVLNTSQFRSANHSGIFDGEYLYCFTFYNGKGATH